MDESKDDFRSTLFKFLKFCSLAILLLYLAASVVVVMVLRYPVWHVHLLQLMYRTWVLFVAQQMGSTSPGFVNSLVATLAGIALTAIGIYCFQGPAAMKKHIIETAAMSIVGLATLLLLVYGTQFAWEVARAGYDDHQALVASVSKLLARNNDLKGSAQTDADTITELKNKKCPTGASCPKVAAQTTDALQREPNQCWQNEVFFSGPTASVKGSINTTVGVIHCNYTITAPYCTKAEFNTDKFLGGGAMPANGYTMGTYGVGKEGKTVTYCIAAPALIANSVLTVTVYGTTDENPRLVKSGIGPAR